MKLNLLVIRTADPDALKEQYEALGLTFKHHRHGNGPFHYAAENNGLVFEIYPLLPSVKEADASIRLGFKAVGLENRIRALEAAGWIIVRPLQQTEWGMKMVVQDLDGRKVELSV